MFLLYQLFAGKSIFTLIAKLKPVSARLPRSLPPSPATLASALAANARFRSVASLPHNVAMFIATCVSMFAVNKKPVSRFAPL